MAFGDGFYYCDSIMRQFGGVSCPEMTFMEANKYIFSTTPHVCDPADENGHYGICNWHGAGKHTAGVEDGFGPGDSYTIDTRSPFHVMVSLEEDGGKFIGVKTTFTQGDQSFVIENKDTDYLELMTDDVRAGQVLSISSWKGDDRWLR